MCFMGGGFFGGGGALLMNGNLWPITGILAAGYGLLIGIITGVIFKVLNVSFKTSAIWVVVLSVYHMLWMYLSHYHKWPFVGFLPQSLVVFWMEAFMKMLALLFIGSR